MSQTLTVHTTCDRCGETESVDTDTVTKAVEALADRGWDSPEVGTHLCPDCA